MARDTVLLVDDDPLIRQIARAAMEHFGPYRVMVCSSGREALEVLARRRYDVVLMDCQMPVMDGYEATRLIRSRGGRYADASKELVV